LSRQKNAHMQDTTMTPLFSPSRAFFLLIILTDLHGCARAESDHNSLCPEICTPTLCADGVDGATPCALPADGPVGGGCVGDRCCIGCAAFRSYVNPPLRPRVPAVSRFMPSVVSPAASAARASRHGPALLRRFMRPVLLLSARAAVWNGRGGVQSHEGRPLRNAQPPTLCPFAPSPLDRFEP
jgi:hypothetical protein